MSGRKTRRGFLAALGTVAVATGTVSGADDEPVRIERFEFEDGRIDVTDGETGVVRVTYRNTSSEDVEIFPAFTPFRRKTDESGNTDYEPVAWWDGEISGRKEVVPAGGTVEREYEWTPDRIFDRNATYGAELQVHPADDDRWMAVIDRAKISKAFSVFTEGDCADASVSDSTGTVFVVPGDGECEATQSEAEDESPWWHEDDWYEDDWDDDWHEDEDDGTDDSTDDEWWGDDESEWGDDENTSDDEWDDDSDWWG